MQRLVGRTPAPWAELKRAVTRANCTWVGVMPNWGARMSKSNRGALQDYVARLRRSDRGVAEVLDRMQLEGRRPSWSREVSKAMRSALREPQPPRLEGFGIPEEPPDELDYESIALRLGRPVYEIARGRVVLPTAPEEDDLWPNRLTPSADKLAQAISCVGRINMKNHPGAMPYAGTGWLIAPNVIVTNRHVGRVFAQSEGRGFDFRAGFDRVSKITVDWNPLMEVANTGSHVFSVEEILYIANDTEDDVAFMRVASKDNHTPLGNLEPIGRHYDFPEQVAVIGYPGRDANFPDQSLMEKIFGGVFGRKRFSPGQLNSMDKLGVTHDCSTLGGCSGAPVIDIQTGDVCALHFAGAFLKANYAVPMLRVQALHDRVRQPGSWSIPKAPSTTDGLPPDQTPVQPPRSTVEASGPSQQPGITMTAMAPDNIGSREVRITVPVEIVVRIGGAVVTDTAAASPFPSKSEPPVKAPMSSDAPGAPRAQSSVITYAATSPTVASASFDEALEEARQQLGSRHDVLAIEPGWRFVDGWIKDERAIVVSVRCKKPLDQLPALGVTPLPAHFRGVRVDVRTAALVDARGQAMDTDLLAEAPWQSAYTPMPGLLREVEEAMRIVLHSSPDCGWKHLSGFLGGAPSSLTVGMYDFTAPHVVAAFEQAALNPNSRLSLVLQRGEDIGKGTKLNDFSDVDTVERLRIAFGERLHFAWASVGTGGLFQTSYHIKVAVKDQAAFWLSSGNWQSSNQPVEDPFAGKDTTPTLLATCNREWHVIVENRALADIFEQHLVRDRIQAAEQGGEEAMAEPETMVWVPEDTFQPTQVELEAPTRYFPEIVVSDRIRVMPLLTPDNYAPHVRDLIRSAKKRVWFENQSFSMRERGKNPPHYEQLLESLLECQNNGLDVRIIFRRIGDVRKTVTNARSFGFDPSLIRILTNCHTKGLIVDDGAVLVGSHNWTGAGTTTNRDASLIIYEKRAVDHYAEMLDYDWDRAGPPRIDEGVQPAVVATQDDIVIPPRMVRMPLSKWLGQE
jgi:PLD-like domain/Trypsin-like peptidase domain